MGHLMGTAEPAGVLVQEENLGEAEDDGVGMVFLKKLTRLWSIVSTAPEGGRSGTKV